MEKRIEKLHSMGCKTDEALERMVHDEEFYIDCLQETLDNPGFDKLEAALNAQDIKTAFDAAHALKGMLGNVGLTPMYELIVDIVEPLRAGSCAHLIEKCEALQNMRKQYVEIVS